MQLNDDQLKAIRLASESRFSIITGGAGTGKTTIIKEIDKAVGGVSLWCPTGKASSRLREASGLHSSTIHSAMRYDGTKFACGSLAGQRIVIDESSMLDSWILSEIVKRNPSSLTLVGDNAQLPPVGAGQPFHDLIKIKPDIVAHLNTCYRNKEAIFQAAMKVRAGEMPENATSDGEIFRMYPTPSIDKSVAMLCDMAQDGLIDYDKDIVLTCRNENVSIINDALRKIALPEADERLAVGDRVICGKNFANDDVWNGTTGRITGLSGGVAWVKGDIPFKNSMDGTYEEEIEWNAEILRETKSAYALTVHKSQGSQYRKVFIVVDNADNFMLDRPLIYTAITRAQKECTIIGNVGLMRHAVGKTTSRRTVMQLIGKKI